jgi:hypothetical protein
LDALPVDVVVEEAAGRALGRVLIGPWAWACHVFGNALSQLFQLLGIDEIWDNHNAIALVSGNGLWVKQHRSQRTWE